MHPSLLEDSDKAQGIHPKQLKLDVYWVQNYPKMLKLCRKSSAFGKLHKLTTTTCLFLYANTHLSATSHGVWSVLHTD